MSQAATTDDARRLPNLALDDPHLYLASDSEDKPVGAESGWAIEQYFEGDEERAMRG